MKKIQNILTLPALVAVLTAVGSYSSFANPVTLTFEGLADESQIGGYYNGGGGGNLGITFGPDSLALISAAAGGTGNFIDNPSGSTIAFFLSGPGDVMDVPAGFDTGFSFYYAASGSGSVSVWSGLDGTGSLLATLFLADTGNNGNPYFFNMWVASGITFSGIAESAVFSGAANEIGFDNITLGSSTPGTGVPDGGTSALLLGMGLMGLMGFSRRLAVAK